MTFPLEQLTACLRSFPSLLLAYSGGVDSSLLLEVLRTEADIPFRAVFIDHPGLLDGERQAALSVIQAVGGLVETLSLQEMEKVWSGRQSERCYYCKHLFFSRLLRLADDLQLAVVCDGTHAQDDPARRPGMKALEELGIMSPLRLTGWTKEMIRHQARIMGLSCWDRPARACLAVAVKGPVTGNLLQHLTLLETFTSHALAIPVRFCIDDQQLILRAMDHHHQQVRRLVAGDEFQALIRSMGFMQVVIESLTGGARR
ncbi:MAG: hypothetical protein JXO49_11810 [Deltaproteobacteria bacterium]|nr:hypothetical protein [Candidatus Anaeroferrophillus wilburensis]MBN2890018.1 hypothetical protein [Deltaproteobacteria bacterium]